jgi:hypothetical protein
MCSHPSTAPFIGSILFSPMYYSSFYPRMICTGVHTKLPPKHQINIFARILKRILTFMDFIAQYVL